MFFFLSYVLYIQYTCIIILIIVIIILFIIDLFFLGSVISPLNYLATSPALHPDRPGNVSFLFVKVFLCEYDFIYDRNV